MKLVILTSSSIEELQKKLKLLTNFLDFKQGELPQIERLAIVIDGPTLILTVEDPQAKIDFFRLGLTAASVICCRVSPK
jgi:magnesium-transporting ATPase (P-type)